MLAEISVKAQKDSAPQDSSAIQLHKFYLSINFSPGYCYRTLTNNGMSPQQYQWNKNISDTIDLPDFGFTAGMGIGYQLNHHFSFESGIFVSGNSLKTVECMTYYSASPFPQGPITAGPTTFVQAKNYLHYYYLDVPFQANCLLGKRKLQFIVSAGASLNFFLECKIKIVPYRPAGLQTLKFVSPYQNNAVNLSPFASLGIRWKFSEKIFLSAAPDFHYALFGTAKSSIAMHLWSAGINFGMGFSL
jgi:hypothetical protein